MLSCDKWLAYMVKESFFSQKKKTKERKKMEISSSFSSSYSFLFFIIIFINLYSLWILVVTKLIDIGEQRAAFPHNRYFLTGLDKQISCAFSFIIFIALIVIVIRLILVAVLLFHTSSIIGVNFRQIHNKKCEGNIDKEKKITLTIHNDK
jgi:hypothetical protein